MFLWLYLRARQKLLWFVQTHAEILSKPVTNDAITEIKMDDKSLSQTQDILVYWVRMPHFYMHKATIKNLITIQQNSLKIKIKHHIIQNWSSDNLKMQNLSVVLKPQSDQIPVRSQFVLFKNYYIIKVLMHFINIVVKYNIQPRYQIMRVYLTTAYKLSLITLLLLPTYLSLAFQTQIAPQQRFCFYQVFELQQKYSYKTSNNNILRQVQVSHIEGRQWKSVFFKQSIERNLFVNKLAGTSTTYSFCVKNIGEVADTFKIAFFKGIDVMQLHMLPDATDSQNMDKQLNWLEKQVDVLGQRSENIQGLRRINQQISGLVGTKMMIMAVIGLITIAGINLVFYKVLKGQLKKRKLI